MHPSHGSTEGSTSKTPQNSATGKQEKAIAQNIKQNKLMSMDACFVVALADFSVLAGLYVHYWVSRVHSWMADAAGKDLLPFLQD